jgi:hypothetical protein
MRDEKVLGIAAFMLRKTDPLHRRTEVLFAGRAVVTKAVAPASIDGNTVAFLHRTHAVADRCYGACDLVAERERHSGKNLDLARDDVEVAMAEACALDSNHYLTGPGRRPGHVVDLERFAVRMKSGSLHITLSSSP